MAQAKSPVALKELLSLTALKINPNTIKFKNVTLQSEKYVCVREEGKSLAIIDATTKNVLRLPVQVDSAIMNPITKVVALRGTAAENATTSNLQIYNLEMKSRMKSAELENVEFWKWLDPKTVAVATNNAVYHWSMDGDAAPEKMFDRAPYDGQVQIINYAASEDQKWLLLGGIAASPTGGITGVLQVYSVDVGASQPTMDAHSACFASVKLDGRDAPSNLFCFTSIKDDDAKLNIIEVGVPREQAFKQSARMKFQGADFPVAMLPDNKYGCVFVISKAGLLYLYEIQSGKCLFAQKASQNTMFASCPHSDGGIVTVDQVGAVRRFSIDEANLVPYVSDTLQDSEWAVQLAKRYNLDGAGPLFAKYFASLMQQQRYQEAMELASDSPKGVLRTVDTINQFKALPALGPTSALLQYFSLLLKKGSLNAIESIELARPVLQKGLPAGLKHIQEWLQKNQLECSEELGDLLKAHDINLALSVYGRAKIPEKVIGCFLALAAKEPDQSVATGHFQKIFKYAKTTNFAPDYPLLVQQLLRVNPERAKDFALLLLHNEDDQPAIDINTLVNTFMSMNDVKNTTNILLEYLKSRGDREEDADLQTKLLEINLLSMPTVANAILEHDDYKFTHYDRHKIAQLCEHAQLFMRALEHYDDLEDIKRVLIHAPQISPEFLLEYFGRMTPENCLECLRDLLKYNQQQNIRLVVDIAKKWSDTLTPEKLIGLFEEFKNYSGLFFYLGSFVNNTDDQKVVFKYIQAGVELQQLREVERICRDNDHYDAKEVKEYLLEKNLKDPRPLIHVCDRFDFVDELTHFLYSNNMFPFIEAYVQRMNSRAAPTVVGALLDLNANEEQIREMMSSVRPPLDDEKFMERLVHAAESHQRLKILQPWLEARANEGNTEVHLHNGLAKIYVESNSNPQQFLVNNKFYDSKAVGAFCESRDPHLAFIAYKRAAGTCDDELIAVTNKNGFFKDQARYLVERQDLVLWERVLVTENQYRRQLIDQVVATALPESKIPEEVSTTVKAFMAANLPNELIELLEKIILQGPTDGIFHKNKNLQNLLILTAIKADKKRVMDYINRLDNYDGPEIAKIAIQAQHELYEEGFFIYKKFKKGPQAIEVLLHNIKDIQRATEFAEYWDQADVWSLLAKAQLDQKLVKESIGSYLKARDPSNYAAVIVAAKGAGFFQELIDFLLMARETIREVVVDNELIYSYAKTARMADLEDFLMKPHIAKLEACGDQCYAEKLYEAGRILFNQINHNAKLALCLVKLGLFQEAVDAARKANSIPTWKAVCFACVDAQKFRLAQMCGINIIVYNDHLLDLSRYYEARLHFNEVIQLLEQGINLDRAHQGIYTQLGILYAKYKEEKLMEHIKLFWSRLNIPQLLQCCQENQHWPETVFLFRHYAQFDNAVNTMIAHSTECWSNDLFKEVVSKVSSTDIYYKAIDFYLDEHPLLLNDLLLDLSNNLDHTRVVRKIVDAGHLPLIQKYLLHVQRENLPAVNEAVNELFLQEEDYKSLRESIDVYDSFDQIALAQRIEKHELVEFRRISSYLYKLNKRWEKSIDLSKEDSLWGDSMETASESKDTELAEQLLRFFVDKKLNEAFCACLFTCYELIRPDAVLELAWRFNLMNFAMPFMVQSVRHSNERVEALTKKVEELAKAHDEKAAKAEAPSPAIAALHMNMPLALPAPSYGPPPSYPPPMGFPPVPGYFPTH